MNYLKIYHKIVNNRLKNPYQEYTEKHHIIPASLGGTNSRDNIVKLTAREHFICHWLLVKMYRGNKNSYYKMLKAFNMMCNSITAKQERYNTCSRIFARYREDLSKAMSASQIGENNSQAGTRWICNIDLKENKKITSTEPIPNGWVAGRNKWVTPKEKEKVVKPKISKKYLNGYKVSIGSVTYDSISQAADSIGISHETARMRFKSKNFPQYLILTL